MPHDIDQYDPESLEYTFALSRNQFGLLIVGVAFMGMSFFVFGYHLGQRVAGVEVRSAGFAQLPEPTPQQEDNVYIVGAESPATHNAEPTPVPTQPDEIDLMEQEFGQLDRLAGDRDPTLPPLPTREPVAPTQAPPTQAPTAIPPTRTPPPPRPSQPSATVENAQFTVQLASFKDRANAEALARELRDKGSDAYIQAVNLTPTDLRFRVRVGGFATRPDALQVLRVLQDQGYRSGFISPID